MEKPKITIQELLHKAPEEMKLELLAGAESLNQREIVSSRIQKLGLALAGFAHYVHAGRVQIVGQSEVWYLTQLEQDKRRTAILNLDLSTICCVLVTKGLEVPEDLLEIATEHHLPVLRTELVSSTAINRLTAFLEFILAPQRSVHGVLLDLYGIGVLITGESGIGKSECALDLVSRGHRLISDDVVIIKRIGEKLEGTAPDLTRDILEIRGLGIINIKEMFGVSSVAERKEVGLNVEMVAWNRAGEIERLGLDQQEEDYLGLKVNKFVIPVSPGRDLAVLLETATRVHLLKKGGYDAAKILAQKHLDLLSKQNK
jgi:HPr kinase/phosphorylase